jgi:hypothetical protein
MPSRRFSELDPGRRVIAGTFEPPHLAVYARVNQPLCSLGIQQKMVDAKSGISLPAMPLVVPECMERAEPPATGWLCWEAAANLSRQSISLITGKIQGTFPDLAAKARRRLGFPIISQLLTPKFPTHPEQGIVSRIAGKIAG